MTTYSKILLEKNSIPYFQVNTYPELTKYNTIKNAVVFVNSDLLGNPSFYYNDTTQGWIKIGATASQIIGLVKSDLYNENIVFDFTATTQQTLNANDIKRHTRIFCQNLQAGQTNILTIPSYSNLLDTFEIAIYNLSTTEQLNLTTTAGNDKIGDIQLANNIYYKLNELNNNNYNNTTNSPMFDNVKLNYINNQINTIFELKIIILLIIKIYDILFI